MHPEPSTTISDPEAQPSKRLATAKGFVGALRLRIVAMVLFTMIVSALVVGPEVPPWPALLHALFGSALVIVGAMALNQRLERDSDTKMPRTASRPLPTNRLTAGQMTLFGCVTTVAGLAYLGLLVNLPIAILALVSWLIYVWVYTPLKRLTVWQTPIGAVAGAMPTLLGAAAAGSPMSIDAWTLFWVVFFWQFAHAMAIAWLHREQFAAGQTRLATVADPSGRTAGIVAVLGTLALVPLSLVPALAGMAGPAYAAAATVLGLGYLGLAVRFLLRRDDSAARALLRGSVIYLPLLFGALLAGRLLS